MPLWLEKERKNPATGLLVSRSAVGIAYEPTRQVYIAVSLHGNEKRKNIQIGWCCVCNGVYVCSHVGCLWCLLLWCGSCLLVPLNITPHMENWLKKNNFKDGKQSASVSGN